MYAANGKLQYNIPNEHSLMSHQFLFQINIVLRKSHLE